MKLLGKKMKVETWLGILVFFLLVNLCIVTLFLSQGATYWFLSKFDKKNNNASVTHFVGKVEAFYGKNKIVSMTLDDYIITVMPINKNQGK